MAAASSSIVSDRYILSIETTSDIPRYCTGLAALLDVQPWFKGYGSLRNTCKVVPLESPVDARICNIFSRNAREILGKEQAWHIHHFGMGNNQLYNSDRSLIKCGVTLWIYENFTRCSLETLEKAYQDVLSGLRSGWTPANIKDHPNIIPPENADEFVLFIKAKPLIEENVLIYCIATRFGMKEDVKCYDDWEAHTGPERGHLYLWIRKTSHENIADKFGFQF